jgi:4'-phosphopantetheinyl transferase
MSLNYLSLNSVKIPGKEEVHIWMADLNISESIQQHFEKSFLSNEELAKAKSFKFDQHRLQFSASHGYLRFILAQYLNCCPSLIEYEIGEYGKPSLKNPSNPDKIRFNMSHSQNMALYAVTLDVEVGVDIEIIKDDLNIPDLIEHVFTTRENNIFKEIKEDKKTKVFYDVWTRKEAYLKATGEGFNFPLNKIEVTTYPDEEVKLLNVERNQSVNPWSLYSLELPEYSASIAIKRKKNLLRYIEMRELEHMLKISGLIPFIYHFSLGL